MPAQAGPKALNKDMALVAAPLAAPRCFWV